MKLGMQIALAGTFAFTLVGLPRTASAAGPTYDSLKNKTLSGAARGHISCSGGGVASCQDTSATFTLRAFIPEALNVVGGGLRNGPWMEPVPAATCRFYGDERTFSDVVTASSRQSNIIQMPMMQPGACVANSAGFRAFCDASHQDCFDSSRGDFGPKRAATATAQFVFQRSSCSGASLTAESRVYSSYPFAPFGAGPSIFDTMHVTSSTVASTPQIRTQTYDVSFEHTPFPNHELLVTYCGRTESLTAGRYAATDPGPSWSNLGSPHADDIRAAGITVSLKRNASCKSVKRVK